MTGAADADNYVFSLDGHFFNTASASSNHACFNMLVSDATSGNTDGTAAATISTSYSKIGQHISGTFNSASDLTLSITFQHNSATTNHISVLTGAYVTYI